jgi:hypothetical protein
MKPTNLEWSVHSTSNPKWNKKGEGIGIISCEGPKEMQEWMSKCFQKFKKEPNDLILRVKIKKN